SSAAAISRASAPALPASFITGTTTLNSMLSAKTAQDAEKCGVSYRLGQNKARGLNRRGVAPPFVPVRVRPHAANQEKGGDDERVPAHVRISRQVLRRCTRPKISDGEGRKERRDNKPTDPRRIRKPHSASMRLSIIARQARRRSLQGGAMA